MQWVGYPLRLASRCHKAECHCSGAFRLFALQPGMCGGRGAAPPYGHFHVSHPLMPRRLLPPSCQSGVYVAGTELEGLHREVLVRAVRHLEQQGRAKLFKGTTGDDEGVKFFG